MKMASCTALLGLVLLGCLSGKSFLFILLALHAGLDLLSLCILKESTASWGCDGLGIWSLSAMSFTLVQINTGDLCFKLFSLSGDYGAKEG